MSRRSRTRLLPMLALAVALLPGALVAQQERGEPSDRPGRAEELREAIRENFSHRMRQALALDDGQMATILPEVERIERARQRSIRQRAETVRRLREGLRGGAEDAELQRLLERLDGIEQEQRQVEREGLRTIDGHLSVRQRVEFRFFIREFRQDLQRRVQQFRDRPNGGRRRR